MVDRAVEVNPNIIYLKHSSVSGKINPVFLLFSHFSARIRASRVKRRSLTAKGILKTKKNYRLRIRYTAAAHCTANAAGMNETVPINGRPASSSFGLRGVSVE